MYIYRSAPYKGKRGVTNVTAQKSADKPSKCEGLHGNKCNCYFLKYRVTKQCSCYFWRYLWIKK